MKYQKRNRVTIELSGGLGNQLFQVCTLLGYALHHGRPYFLEKKSIAGPRKTVYWNNIFQSLKPNLERPKMIGKIYRGIQKLFKRDIKIGPAKQQVFRETQFHYVPIPCFAGGSNVKMIGYFQSYKYFDEYKFDIFRLLELELRKKRILQKTSYDYGNTVSLHFRIGDYKQKQNYHPLMPTEYYLCALTQLIKDTEKDLWNVLYFCEEKDSGLVSQKILNIKKKFPTMTFEKINRQLKDWEQILAMSLCRHHVIANSTFSWWGAYFNTNDTTHVYYPKMWFGLDYEEYDTKDLCPVSWHRICT